MSQSGEGGLAIRRSPRLRKLTTAGMGLKLSAIQSKEKAAYSAALKAIQEISKEELENISSAKRIQLDNLLACHADILDELASLSDVPKADKEAMLDYFEGHRSQLDRNLRIIKSQEMSEKPEDIAWGEGAEPEIDGAVSLDTAAPETSQVKMMLPSGGKIHISPSVSPTPSIASSATSERARAELMRKKLEAELQLMDKRNQDVSGPWDVFLRFIQDVMVG